MRFAYIDSQGNEVSIPSVDALALRIELGAIGPETQLYDAQADRWGPAQSHDIFHTLARVASSEDGFTAPPPPVVPSVPDTPDDASDPPKKSPRGAAGGDGLRFEPAEATGSPASGEPPASPEPMDAPDDELDFEFTLTEPAAPPAPEAPRTAPDEEAGGEPVMDFSFTPTPEAPPSPPPAVKGPPASSRPDDAGSGPPAGGLTGTPGDPTDIFEPLTDDDAEALLDFTTGGGGMAGDLELEPPMSAFSGDNPPAWMAPASEVFEDPETMSFTDPEPAEDREGLGVPRATGGEATPEHPGRFDAAARERPEPRSRPSPPRRIRRRSLTGPLGFLLVVTALGAGGYYGYETFVAGRSANADTDAPSGRGEVTLPPIPEALVPKLRQAGDAALTGMVRQLQTERRGLRLAAEPNGDWLAGVYLANASQFSDVQEYWEGIGALVDSVRNGDARIFHEQVTAQVGRVGLTGDTASMLVARADSGFLATRPERSTAYVQMDDLVGAALDLHRFLLTHEAEIEYAPAAGGMSRDPVLEAVPASKALGDEMWDMVDRITSALDALGSLDKVTTDRLAAVLFDRIREAGFK